MLIKRWPLLFLAAHLFLVSCKPESDKDDEVVKTTVEGLTASEENTIGANIAANLDKEVVFYTPSAGMEDVSWYFEKLFQQVIQTPEVQQRSAYAWSLQVIVNDTVQNLFTLPGGKMYITTGLLKAIDNETEFMGVVAHEIYYADQGLVTIELKRRFGSVVLGDLMLSKTPSEIKALTEWIRNIPYSGPKVNAADAWSTQLMCQFLYSPQGLYSFLDRAEKLEQQPAWVYNRPLTAAERVDAMADAVKSCGLDGPRYRTRYQEILSKLP